MFCEKCGTQCADGTAFCNNCGAALNNANAGATQATYQQPQYQQPQYQQPQYQQPQYQQPQYQQPATTKQPGHGLAVASLVLGILSFIVAAVICGSLGIALGGAAKSKGNKSPMATAGIVCGCIGVGLWLLAIIFWNATFMSMF